MWWLMRCGGSWVGKVVQQHEIEVVIVPGSILASLKISCNWWRYPVCGGGGYETIPPQLRESEYQIESGRLAARMTGCKGRNDTTKCNTFLFFQHRLKLKKGSLATKFPLLVDA